MSTMITEVYKAFKKPGVPEEDAQKAAEAISQRSSATRSDIQKIEREIVEIKDEIKLTKWMIGLLIAINVIPMIKELIN